MKKILVLSGFALAAMAAMVSMPALATPISATINLSTVYTGNIPDGSAPWLTAEFTSNTGSLNGTLTLASNLSNSDFLQGLSSNKAAIGWAFYLNPRVTGSTVSISCTSGTCADSASWNASGFNSGPVPGVFNLAFGWSSQNRFLSGSSAVYGLTFSSALTGNPFGLNGDQWSSVAHVQGITGGCSGWIVSGTGRTHGGSPCITPLVRTVPEPGELGMFGLGLLLMGLLVGLRRRYD